RHPPGAARQLEHGTRADAGSDVDIPADVVVASSHDVLALPVIQHASPREGVLMAQRRTSRNTMPVRGLGQKNVVFGGMRSRARPTSAIWATVAGRSSTAASASPLVTAATARSQPCWYVSWCGGSVASATSRRLESRS